MCKKIGLLRKLYIVLWCLLDACSGRFQGFDQLAPEALAFSTPDQSLFQQNSNMAVDFIPLYRNFHHGQSLSQTRFLNANVNRARGGWQETRGHQLRNDSAENSVQNFYRHIDQSNGRPSVLSQDQQLRGWPGLQVRPTARPSSFVHLDIRNSEAYFRPVNFPVLTNAINKPGNNNNVLKAARQSTKNTEQNPKQNVALENERKAQVPSDVTRSSYGVSSGFSNVPVSRLRMQLSSGRQIGQSGKMPNPGPGSAFKVAPETRNFHTNDPSIETPTGQTAQLRVPSIRALANAKVRESLPNESHLRVDSYQMSPNTGLDGARLVSRRINSPRRGYDDHSRNTFTARNRFSQNERPAVINSMVFRQNVETEPVVANFRRRLNTNNIQSSAGNSRFSWQEMPVLSLATVAQRSNTVANPTMVISPLAKDPAKREFWWLSNPVSRVASEMLVPVDSIPSNRTLTESSAGNVADITNSLSATQYQTYEIQSAKESGNLRDKNQIPLPSEITVVNDNVVHIQNATIEDGLFFPAFNSSMSTTSNTKRKVGPDSTADESLHVQNSLAKLLIKNKLSAGISHNNSNVAGVRSGRYKRPSDSLLTRAIKTKEITNELVKELIAMQKFQELSEVTVDMSNVLDATLDTVVEDLVVQNDLDSVFADNTTYKAGSETEIERIKTVMADDRENFSQNVLVNDSNALEETTVSFDTSHNSTSYYIKSERIETTQSFSPIAEEIPNLTQTLSHRIIESKLDFQPTTERAQKANPTTQGASTDFTSMKTAFESVASLRNNDKLDDSTTSKIPFSLPPSIPTPAAYKTSTLVSVEAETKPQESHNSSSVYGQDAANNMTDPTRILFISGNGEVRNFSSLGQDIQSSLSYFNNFIRPNLSESNVDSNRMKQALEKYESDYINDSSVTLSPNETKSLETKMSPSLFSALTSLAPRYPQSHSSPTQTERQEKLESFNYIFGNRWPKENQYTTPVWTNSFYSLIPQTDGFVKDIFVDQQKTVTSQFNT